MSKPKPTPAPKSEATIGSLIADISADLSELIRSEIRLAKSELKVSVNAGGMTIALLAMAAFFGLLLIIMLSITLAFFITMFGLHPAWAFLIVSGLYVLVIAILAFLAWRKSRKVHAPEKTIETLHDIPSSFKKASAKSIPTTQPAKAAPTTQPAKSAQPDQRADASGQVTGSRTAGAVREQQTTAETSNH